MASSQKQQQQSSPSKVTTEIQEKVNEVVGIMQTNIDKVMERGERLDALQSKSENLNNAAGQFRRGATKVSRKLWWQNMRLKILIAAIIVAIILAIVLPLTLSK